MNTTTPNQPLTVGDSIRWRTSGNDVYVTVVAVGTQESPNAVTLRWRSGYTETYDYGIFWTYYHNR